MQTSRLIKGYFEIARSALTLAKRNASSFIQTEDVKVLKDMQSDMLVVEDFLTEAEEVQLLEEIEPYMKKLRYEFDHWDDVRYTIGSYALYFL